MTTSQKKGFDNLFMSPVITSMAQGKIIVVAKGEYTEPVAILINLYQ